MYTINFTAKELAEMEANDELLLGNCVTAVTHRRY